MRSSEFSRGDHVRIVPTGTVGQVTHVFRAPGRSEALEYDVTGWDRSKNVVRPENLEPAPMYVIVERCPDRSGRGPVVYDCHPDSDLENVQLRVAGRQENADRSGRPEDTYRVAELRFVDTVATPARDDKWAAAEAGIYAEALLKIERELDQYRGAKVLREGVRLAVEQARSRVAELVAGDTRPNSSEGGEAR